MPHQTFPVGEAPRIHIDECTGSLHVEGWDERRVEVDTAGAEDRIDQQDGTLRIERISGNLHLRVPRDSTIAAEHVRANVAARHIAALELDHGGGSVHLEEVDAVQIDHAAAEVSISRATTIAIGRIGGSLNVDAAETIRVDKVGANCTIKGAGGSFHFGKVGGSLVVEGDGRVVVVGDNARANLHIARVQSVQIDHVGGSATVRAVQGDVRIGNVGANCEMAEVEGSLSLGHVGGSATVRDVAAVAAIGKVSSNLHLQGAKLGLDASSERAMEMSVGGSAHIELPGEANLTIRARVGGTVHGDGVRVGIPGRSKIIYGDGAARLDLAVGGNLELHGGGRAQVAGSSSNETSGRPLPATGQTIRLGKGAPAPASAAEPPASDSEERIAVLRMIASGRITAEQGAQLLEVLA